MLATSLAAFLILGVKLIVFTTNSPILSLMISYTFVLNLMIFSQHCLPLEVMCAIVAIVSQGLKVACRLSVHYGILFTNICVWISHLKQVGFVVVLIVTLFGVITALGCGMPLVMIVIMFKRFYPISFLLKYHFALSDDDIPYIMLGGNDRDGTTVPVLTLRTNNPTSNGAAVKRPMRNTDKENCCHQNGSPPPPKRGRKSSKDSGHKCGSCTVWLQTGSSQELLKYHKMVVGRVHHPGEKAIDFTTFLSCNGAYGNISLRCDSCMCDVCYSCLLYTSPSPRDATLSRMPSSA